MWVEVHWTLSLTQRSIKYTLGTIADLLDPPYNHHNIHKNSYFWWKMGPKLIYIAKRVSDCLTYIKKLVRLILVCPLSNWTPTILQKCMQVIKNVKSLTLFKAGKFVIWVKRLISCQNRAIGPKPRFAGLRPAPVWQ